LNPISAETEVMRTSLLPGLLSSFLRNYNRGMKTARLYELGRLYLGMEGDISREEESLGMINSGFAQEKTPYGEAVSFGFFDLKGDVEILLEAVRLPVDRVSYVRSPGSSADLEYYHPAVACELWIDQTKIGIMGRLHPELCEAYKIRQPVFAAELQLGLCYRFQVDEQIFREFPKYPSVQRDISIIVDKSTEYKAIEWAILSVGIEEVQQVYPFDLYLGDKLPASKKGVSISIVFQSKDRTLLEEEIVQYQESILKALSQKLGATLRT
jgi:phenylalanyl-tRNA synthetase beta chain